MIRVDINTNFVKEEVIVAETTTVKELLKDNNIDPIRTPIYLNGDALSMTELEKPIGDFAEDDYVMVSGIVKTANAL